MIHSVIKPSVNPPTNNDKTGNDSFEIRVKHEL